MSSREIKFRVWNGTEMEYRVMAGYLGAFYCAGLDKNDSACMSPFNTIYNENTPVMQYTGLKDYDGREIYDGDILRDASEQQNLVVSFNDGGFITNNKEHPENGYYLTHERAQTYYILGNIYENPELLK